ncbi:MAG: glycosyltransferase [Chloroflexota bacterium]|nr:glycosyltransferase [Chloroflexota bacterium]
MPCVRACWISSTRYSQPLNATQAKKWAALAAAGMDITVVGFATDAHWRRFSQSARFILLPLLPFALLRYALMFVLTPLLLFRLAWRGRVNTFIAQSPYEGFPAALARQLLALCGRRTALLVEAHGDFEESLFLYRRIPFASVVRWLMRRVSDYTLHHADALRAVSSTTQAQLQQRAAGKPIEQFLTWTDVEVFQNTPRTLAPSASHDLLYVGQLVPLKGVHLLIDAFAQVCAVSHAAHLHLIGRPDNAEYAAQLQEQVVRLGLQERVTFTGALDQAQLAGRLAAARALILPSFSEGMPRVLVEAMVCGTPVIATRVGGVPDLVQTDRNGWLIDARDTEALAGALHNLLTSADVDALGATARTDATALFSTEQYVDGYRRLFAHAERALCP